MIHNGNPVSLLKEHQSDMRESCSFLRMNTNSSSLPTISKLILQNHINSIYQQNIMPYSVKHLRKVSKNTVNLKASFRKSWYIIRWLNLCPRVALWGHGDGWTLYIWITGEYYDFLCTKFNFVLMLHIHDMNNTTPIVVPTVFKIFQC